MTTDPLDTAHAGKRLADKFGMKAGPAVLDLCDLEKRRTERTRGTFKLALTDGFAAALGHRFEAVVFDWDGTAVADRKARPCDRRPRCHPSRTQRPRTGGLARPRSHP